MRCGMRYADNASAAMIEVSLRDWLATGRFGDITLGLSRDDVTAAVGPPEAVGGTSRRHRLPAIWKYGDVELHFARTGGRLALIHLEPPDAPSGGRGIALAAGPLRGGRARDAVERWLDSEGIAHRLEAPGDTDTARLVTPSGVVLTFVERAAPYSSPPGLFALSQSVPHS
jgi:hypothetical protein